MFGRIALMAAVGVLATAVAARAPDAVDAGPTDGAGADWRNHGGGGDEGGFSRLDDVTPATVGRLGLAWSLDLPGEVTLEATPLAVGGVLYFSGTYAAVYAVDGASGRLLWKYDPEFWRHDPARMKLNFAANRGVAYAGGRVFVTSFDGRMIALDAKTGKLLWSAETIAPGSSYFSTGAPLAFGDKVMIGNGGGDYGARGYVTAFDQATGRRVWRFYTAPGSPDENRPENNGGDPAMEAAAKTWSGEYWKTGTGGTVWNTMIFDPELNRVYIGTGNSGPYDPAIRSPAVNGVGGDNLYLVSIVALDANTGKYVWHYQENPREAWDYKATANLIMATIAVGGQSRKVLLHAPTNGFFYVLDRATGRLISAEKTGKVTWADRIDLATGRPVERPGIRYETADSVMYPGPAGAHNWQPMAYNPGTGLVYIPAQQQGMRYGKSAATNPGANPALAMSAVSGNPDDKTGWLQAWDPVRQRQAWKVRLDSFWNGGALTTAGNLVFQGTSDGWLYGYDARDGRRVWRFNAGLGIQGAPISFAAGGRQYISILVGYGGAAAAGSIHMGWKYNAQPRRLLTFALDGRTKLPPTAPPDFSVAALDDPALHLAEADVHAGAALFGTCAVCHGRDAESAGTAPDLRESALVLDPAAFRSVVHDGALRHNGMPPFANLSDPQLRQIAAYVRARARDALGTRTSGVHSGQGSHY